MEWISVSDPPRTGNDVLFANLDERCFLGFYYKDAFYDREGRRIDAVAWWMYVPFLPDPNAKPLWWPD